MADRTILNNLTYAALLSLDYGNSLGSGFFLNFNDIDFLITARHVLFDKDNLRCKTLTVSSQNSRGGFEDAKMFEIDMTKAEIFQNMSVDVVAIPFGSISDMNIREYINLTQEGRLKIYPISHKEARLIDAIGIANEVYLIGFPTSLIFQGSKHFDPGKPLLRKGIVAGINAEDNTFIIDCSAYYGNSGAPILEVCEKDKEFRLIGIVSKYIPLVIEWKNNREASLTHAEYLNSGYSVCVPIDAIFNLINETL